MKLVTNNVLHGCQCGILYAGLTRWSIMKSLPRTTVLMGAMWRYLCVDKRSKVELSDQDENIGTNKLRKRTLDIWMRD